MSKKKFLESRECLNCKKIFATTLRRNYKFCNQKCSVLFRKGKPRKGNYAKPKTKMLICDSCGLNKIIPDDKDHLNTKYCSKKCYGKRLRFFKTIGNRRIDSRYGYELIYIPSHPFVSNGWIRFHRFIVEHYLKHHNPQSPFLTKIEKNYYLKPSVDVHHIDGDKTNNSLPNLYLCEHIAHTIIHHKDNINIKNNFLVNS